MKLIAFAFLLAGLTISTSGKSTAGDGNDPQSLAISRARKEYRACLTKLHPSNEAKPKSGAESDGYRAVCKNLVKNGIKKCQDDLRVVVKANSAQTLDEDLGIEFTVKNTVSDVIICENDVPNNKDLTENFECLKKNSKKLGSCYGKIGDGSEAKVKLVSGTDRQKIANARKCNELGKVRKCFGEAIPTCTSPVKQHIDRAFQREAAKFGCSV